MWEKRKRTHMAERLPTPTHIPTYMARWRAMVLDGAQFSAIRVGVPAAYFTGANRRVRVSVRPMLLGQRNGGNR